MSLEDERDLAANLEEDADRAGNRQPELPTAAEVVAYAATCGDTVDEVATWLHDHNITDNADINSRGRNITRNCVVAMGLRAHFPALDASANTVSWIVTSYGSVLIHGDDEVNLPEPVRQLVAIADEHRGKPGDPGPYPFLYEAMTACDECGNWIPDSETSEVNDFHAESCSLNPANTV
jgi:hypothetical protein